MNKQLNQNINNNDLNSIHEYSQLLCDILKIRARGDMPMALVRTYGCQQNVADSEKLKGMLKEMGCAFTEDESEADIIIFNTCAIREHAEDRVFGNVGALKNIKRRHPSMIIALCGCMMEQEHIAERIYKSFSFVSLVFGTHEIHNFPKLLYSAVTENKRIVARGNDDGLIHENLPTLRDGAFKGWLSIMYGCNNFCTYCIVPYVRGRERSREPELIMQEAKDMIAAGYKDITLLGQNVNSYGKTLESKKTFASLLADIAELDGDFRLRFMTSHPKDLSNELIDVIASHDKICNHIHLPLQSGSDRILKLMNRHYGRKRYMEIVEYAKKKIPDISLTSDIIVGFPGETYEDFQQTLSLIREVEYTSLFTFIFSPRVGTPAAKMDDPIPYEEKSKWFSELLKVQEEIAAKRCESMVSKQYKVLVESAKPNGELTSRTEENIIVEFDGSEGLIGTFQNVEVTQARNWILKGKLI